ncbi:hypothetical protein Hanom_Chr03g00211221 [Helianthus anomalus]
MHEPTRVNSVRCSGLDLWLGSCYGATRSNSVKPSRPGQLSQLSWSTQLTRSTQSTFDAKMGKHTFNIYVNLSIS